MSIIFVLLMQAVVATDPAPPAPAPATEAAQAAPVTASSMEAAPGSAQAPHEVRCRRRAITGERIARRVCQTVDPDRDQEVADTVRAMQRPGVSAGQ